MRISFSVALLGAAIFGAPALAWESSMTQPATDEVAVFAYPARENYCPDGLQPVRIGGVVCCGIPTHRGYQSHPPARKSATRASYGKGSDTVIVYEKGQ